MRYYTCEYCYKEFEPTRRRVQKYCSNTCRSKAFHERKTVDKETLPVPKPEGTIKVPDLPPYQQKTKVDAMSVSGVGNAAAGSLIADGLKSVFTPKDNKTATKGDLKELFNKLSNRYHRVNNLSPQPDGAQPYFDFDTNNIIYLKPNKGLM